MFGDKNFQGKRIVYVTSAWAGLLDVLAGDGVEPKGMPAFFHPLLELGGQGAKVELIVFSEQTFDSQNVSNSYFQNTKVTILPWPRVRSMQGVAVLMSSFWQMLVKVRRVKPDFMYTHGTTGVLGMIVAKLFKIPFGVRVFGINKYYETYQQLGKLKFIIKSPLFFLMFRLKSDFILATDDGSSADKLFAKIGSPKSNFLFWSNGFDTHVCYEDEEIADKPFILYPSRISDKKQQTKAVELLSLLHQRGFTNLKLKLVGHTTDEDYLDKVAQYAKKLGVGDHVEYCGIFGKGKLFNYMRQAEAVLSVQKVSNLGNSLIEALNCEALVLSFNEPALEKFLENRKSAILVDSIPSAAYELSTFIENSGSCAEVRKLGKQALYSKFSTWRERVSAELDLIRVIVE